MGGKRVERLSIANTRQVMFPYPPHNQYGRLMPLSRQKSAGASSVFSIASGCRVCKGSDVCWGVAGTTGRPREVVLCCVVPQFFFYIFLTHSNEFFSIIFFSFIFVYLFYILYLFLLILLFFKARAVINGLSQSLFREIIC